MRRAGAGVSSVRRLSSWLIVAGGLVLYMTLVLTLVAAGAWPRLPLPWWLAQTVPPMVYGLLIRLSVRHVSWPRWGGATVLFWAAHVLVGVLTGALAAGFQSSAIDQGVITTFPPAPLPPLLWVPLLLMPFRDAIAGDSRLRRRHQARGRERSPVSGDRVPVLASAGGAVAVTASPAPVGAASSDRLTTEARERSGEGGARQASLGRAESPANRAAPQPATGGIGAKVVAEPSPAQRLFDEMLARETSADVVKVSFDRIVGQLPAAAFKLPLERMAASLLEPGYLLVPQRLVLAQLAEGLVRAGWEVVSEQFPRHLLAISDAEITQQIPDGQLVLPLDELVPQLPPELFVPAGSAVDLRGIESFPAPFQPLAPDGRAESPAALVSEGAPAVAEVEPVAETRPVSRVTEWILEDAPEKEGEPSPPPELEDIEADPALMGALGPERALGDRFEAGPGAMPVLDAEPLAVDDERPGEAEPERREPLAAAPAADEVTAEPMAAPAHAVRRNEIAAPPEITSVLAPLGSLNIGAESVGDVTLFTVSSPGVPVDLAVTAARLVLPLLADGRAPWAIDQLTLRGPEARLVLTPLHRRGGPVLVAALRPTGSLALLEILCRRAAARYGGHPEPRRERVEDRDEPDLLDTEPSTWVRRIASSLSAVGPVIASVLREAEAEHALHLFLPPGSDVRAVAGFAYDLCRAMRKAADSGPVFHTAALGCGRRRMIIRLEDRAPGRAGIVVAAGETDRPGLAYRQVESAARALAAG